MNRFAVYSVLFAALAAASVFSAEPRGPATAPAASRPASAPEGARITDDGWFAPRRPKSPHPPVPDEVTRAFIIPIHDEITLGTLESIKRRVIKCRVGKAQLVIFDMDTPGGRSDAMNGIIDLLMDGLRDVRRVAYVNPDAYSAGAMISLACHEIVMAKRAVIGDAMPILIGPGGLMPVPEAERAKLESPGLAQVRSLAEENGYDRATCEGMITVKIEVWLIRNRQTRELRIVDADTKHWRRRVVGAPGIVGSIASDPLKAVGKGEAPRTAPADAEWEFVDVVDKADKLLTLHTTEAVRFGLADNVFATMDDLLAHYNVTAPPTVLVDSWSEKFVGWITDPIIAGLLLAAGSVALFVEIRTPGLGVPGIIALICFTLRFGGQYMAGLATWWEIVIFMIGVVLIVLEIFVIPGFGVAGISGIICCVFGLVAMVIDNPPTEWPVPRGEMGWNMFSTGIFAIVCAFIAAVVLSVVLARYLRNIPYMNRLCLAMAPVVEPQAPVMEDSPIRRIKVGDRGVVESMCRPVGKVRFGDDLIDAVSEGEPIDAGTPVRVLAMDSNRPVVERDQEA